jgi:capsular polysaccharide biosynthesis protein
VPSLHDTMRIFYRARVIVGQHGAGLANMIFSRPGTFVIEGSCIFPAGRLSPAYFAASYHLGHIYFGLTPQGFCMNGRVNTDPSEVKEALDHFLTLNRNTS